TLVLDNLCCSISEDDTRTDQEVFSQLLLDDFRNHQTLAKLQRYETQLERSILRCMKELRDSRKASDANYTDAANYLRDGQPHEDYKDLVTPYGKGETDSNVAQASVLGDNSAPPQADSASNSPEAGRSKLEAHSPNEPNNPVHPVNPVKNNDSSSPSVSSVAKNIVLPNEPNSDRRACVEQQDPVDSRGTEAGSACLDGLTNPDLPWIPAENKVYKTENQRIRNNPNKQKWNYDYKPDWYIRVLDAVHFSPKKRKTMTHTDLEKQAGCIVHTFQNPEQFLLDIHAITLRQKPIEPNSIVAQASALEINSAPPQADSTTNSLKAGRSKLEACSPNEPNYMETPENHYELCEV
ncbi:MAG: hypothetical protein ABFD91_15465, partial [Anaerohalosphaeraceae bacterium]